VRLRSRFILLIVTPCLLPGITRAQQAAAVGEPLIVRTTSLPKALLRQSYRLQLQADGGIKPLKWTLENGGLPRGIDLSEDGVLSGSPSQSGEFHFTLTVADSGKPGRQKSQDLVLQVVAALVAQWDRYPKISGQRLEGSVKVSNRTDQDFDLTFVVLAVNGIGRATAVGYQRLTLKQDTTDFEISFGESLPPGRYDVHVDVVAEVAEEGTIYRARLVSNEALDVRQGP